MLLRWLNLTPVYNAEGVDGGGASGVAGAADSGGSPDTPVNGGDAAASGAEAGFTVAVDGTVPDPAPKAGEADKTDESKTGEADGDVKKDEPKEPEFPHKAEDYTFVLPDGLPADDAKSAEFAAYAIEHKVPPDLAQKFVDFYAKETQAHVKQWVDTVNGWAEATKSDPEYGGAAYAENMAVANVALREFGGPGLGEAARQYGWGNHPEFVRFMVNVGKALGTGSTEKAGGNGNAGTAIPWGQRLYPDAK